MSGEGKDGGGDGAADAGVRLVFEARVHETVSARAVVSNTGSTALYYTWVREERANELGGPGASELPEHFAKFSVHATKLAALADQIYILCTECSLGIPEDWRAKTSFVHGFRIDECLKTQGIDHWHKA